MFIEGIEKCKHCGVMPDFEFAKQHFSFICPKCGGMSSTHRVHGIEQAVCDWNNYHTDKEWSTPDYLNR